MIRLAQSSGEFFKAEVFQTKNDCRLDVQFKTFHSTEEKGESAPRNSNKFGIHVYFLPGKSYEVGCGVLCNKISRFSIKHFKDFSNYLLSRREKLTFDVLLSIAEQIEGEIIVEGNGYIVSLTNRLLPDGKVDANTKALHIFGYSNCSVNLSQFSFDRILESERASKSCLKRLCTKIAFLSEKEIFLMESILSDEKEEPLTLSKLSTVIYEIVCPVPQLLINTDTFTVKITLGDSMSPNIGILTFQTKNFLSAQDPCTYTSSTAISFKNTEKLQDEDFEQLLDNLSLLTLNQLLELVKVLLTTKTDEVFAKAQECVTALVENGKIA